MHGHTWDCVCLAALAIGTEVSAFQHGFLYRLNIPGRLVEPVLNPRCSLIVAYSVYWCSQNISVCGEYTARA